MNYIVIASIICSVLCLVYVFLYIFHKKLEKLETQIVTLFRARTDTIPGIYEVSKEHLTKHEDIFREALRLKKVEFGLLENSKKLYNLTETE